MPILESSLPNVMMKLAKVEKLHYKSAGNRNFLHFGSAISEVDTTSLKYMCQNQAQSLLISFSTPDKKSAAPPLPNNSVARFLSYFL